MQKGDVKGQKKQKEQQKAKLKGVPSGESHTGFSRCCSVCVDGADDTKRDSHGVQAFLEVKSRILTNIEGADNSNIQLQEKDNNLFNIYKILPLFCGPAFLPGHILLTKGTVYILSH